MRRSILIAGALAAVLLGDSSWGAKQPAGRVAPTAKASDAASVAALRREVAELREQVRLLGQELQAFKSLVVARLSPRPAPDASTGSAPAATTPAATVDSEIAVIGKPSRGRDDARITVVELSDYQCPYCARFTQDVYPQLDRDYVQTGKVRFVHRDFPLNSHANAWKAAEAVRCADEQGKYWEMHESLFAHQNALAPENLLQYAGDLGLDTTRFKNCLDTSAHAIAIRSDKDEVSAIGVRSVPTILVGVTPSFPNTKMRIIRRFQGAPPYDQLKQAIDSIP